MEAPERMYHDRYGEQEAHAFFIRANIDREQEAANARVQMQVVHIQGRIRGSLRKIGYLASILSAVGGASTACVGLYVAHRVMAFVGMGLSVVGLLGLLHA
jgi:hypothetical protein